MIALSVSYFALSVEYWIYRLDIFVAPLSKMRAKARCVQHSTFDRQLGDQLNVITK